MTRQPAPGYALQLAAVLILGNLIFDAFFDFHGALVIAGQFSVIFLVALLFFFPLARSRAFSSLGSKLFSGPALGLVFGVLGTCLLLLAIKPSMNR